MAKSNKKVHSVNGKNIRRSADGVYSIVWLKYIIHLK